MVCGRKTRRGKELVSRRDRDLTSLQTFHVGVQFLGVSLLYWKYTRYVAAKKALGNCSRCCLGELFDGAEGTVRNQERDYAIASSFCRVERQPWECGRKLNHLYPVLIPTEGAGVFRGEVAARSRC